MRLDRLLNLDDVERAARGRVPKPVFDVIAGGAGDEETIARNRRAFGELQLRPRAMPQISRIDLTTTILGTSVSMPVVLGPAGWQRMVHRDAELAVARAAGKAGALFALSTVSAYSLEEVAAAATGPRWFQFYYPPGAEGKVHARDLVRRADEAGYDALCVTLDTTLKGLRERDTRNRVTIPFQLTPRLVAQAAVRPQWALDFLRGGNGRGSFGVTAAMRDIREAGDAVSGTNGIVTLEELHWLRQAWTRPLVVKGVLRGDDCQQFLDAGVDGIVVSNHGGRQLDSVPATIEVLPEIVDAVGGRAQVFLDGGVRRGVDVVKALALGATAVLLGRPYVYGLAAGGEAGVTRVLDIMRSELQNALGLLGYDTPGELDPSCLRMIGERAPALRAQ